MKYIVGSLLLATAGSAFASGSPWLIAPGDTNAQVSFSVQEADEFYLGNNKRDLPDDITNSTLLLNITHGITDDVELNVRTGYAETEFDPAPDQDGLYDTTVGLTFRFNDEFIEDGPSAAIKVAATIAGDYDSTHINSIGDDANGIEGSLIVGQTFGQFAVSGEAGYRYRDKNVPNETFYNLNAYYSINQHISLSAGYHVIDSDGDLDIGGPGFSPARFAETEEDNQSYSLGANYQINDKFSVGVNYASVMDGRNTADREIVSINTGFSF